MTGACRRARCCVGACGIFHPQELSVAPLLRVVRLVRFWTLVFRRELWSRPREPTRFCPPWRDPPSSCSDGPWQRIGPTEAAFRELGASSGIQTSPGIRRSPVNLGQVEALIERVGLGKGLHVRLDPLSKQLRRFSCVAAEPLICVVAGDHARIPRRSATAQQGAALSGGSAQGRGDRRRHARRRRLHARPAAARPDCDPAARRATDPGSAQPRRSRPRSRPRRLARPTRQGRPAPRGRHGPMGLG